jgi:hypothetical protein
VTAGDQAPVQVSTEALDTWIDLTDARKAERQHADAAAAEQAKAEGGGTCSRCGCPESWEAPGKGGWPSGDHLGPICWPCKRDLELAGDDTSHRVMVCDRLLGDLPPPGWASVVPGAPTVAARWETSFKAKAMAWWCETPRAPVGQGTARFTYTSAEELAASLYEEPRQLREQAKASLRSRGRRFRCEGCGTRGGLWQVQQVGVSAPTTSDGELSRVARAHFRVTWTCTCGHQDVEERAEQLVGVPVSGLVG